MKRKPIPLLYFTNALTRGGAEEHILTLLRGLDRGSWRPLLACPPELAAHMEPDLPPDVPMFPVRLRKPTDVRAALRLARILRQEQVGVLHSHLFFSSLYASPIGWLCRVPVIVETPHIREQWRKGWLKSRFFVDRAVGRMVDYYIAISEANARYLVETKGLPKHKIVVIRSASDVKRFDPARPAPAGLKTSLGFAESDPVLVVVGRLEPQKGHRVLLDAMPAVSREFPRVRLVCLSEGSLRPALEQHAIALGIAELVRFVGRQPDVRDWFAIADLCVLPSFYEGLPLAAIEALAAGRPIVATAVDGTPEVVLHGRTGLTVPPGDPERLAQAICELLRNPDAAKAFGQVGRQWVVEHFSQETLLEATQRLYLQAWERSRRHATELRRLQLTERGPENPREDIPRTETGRVATYAKKD